MFPKVTLVNKDEEIMPSPLLTLTFTLTPWQFVPANKALINTYTTEAICEFLGLKMVENQYPVPVQANWVARVAT